MMATLVLGTIGRALGGPLGGLAGTLLGGVVDQNLFGTTREGPREANLKVQSAAYGEPLPRLYGRMRVAGNLVWTAGIVETRTRSGGGKRGTATNTYSYSASFAVVVSARPIVLIERIWADGKLLRAGDGGLIYPATIRTYTGGEAQPVDALIAAAETTGLAPAYRDRAYAVFEDLPLADYGNRIPNLTFEVIADDAEVGVDTIARDLAGNGLTIAGSFPTVLGFAASRAGSVRQTLTQLTDFADLPFRDGDAGLVLGSDVAPRAIAVADLGVVTSATPDFARRETRQGDVAVPDALVIGFSDPARDFQPGLQRAVRRTPPVRTSQRDLAAALTAPAAKQLAETILRRAIAARTTGVLTLPWRYATQRPGDIISVMDEPEPWRIKRWTLAGAAIELEVERVVAPASGAQQEVDPGRVYDADDTPPGATVLHILDLPSIAGALPTAPRLLLAAAGASRGWRGADVVASRDSGAAYASLATIDAPSTMGIVDVTLVPGQTDRWDRLSSLDVTLLADTMTLASASEAAVLAGANIALAGDEIIQFATATPLGPRRFRLQTLLRGRRGTEAAAASHAAGERFVMLDADRVVGVDIAIETLGAPLAVKALGPGDDMAAVPAQVIVPAGNGLRPLAPVALTARQGSDGSWTVAWTRRSRAGFGWVDGTDVPLGEDTERYSMSASLDGVLVRVANTTEPRWIYDAATFTADGGAAARLLVIAVAQISPAVGPGAARMITIDLAAIPERIFHG